MFLYDILTIQLESPEVFSPQQQMQQCILRSRSMNENGRQVDQIIIWNIVSNNFQIYFMHQQYNVSNPRLEEKVRGNRFTIFKLSFFHIQQIMKFNWQDYLTEHIWENNFVYLYVRNHCFMNNQSEKFHHLQPNVFQITPRGWLKWSKPWAWWYAPSKSKVGIPLGAKKF